MGIEPRIYICLFFFQALWFSFEIDLWDEVFQTNTNYYNDDDEYAGDDHDDDDGDDDGDDDNDNNNNSNDNKNQ